MGISQVCKVFSFPCWSFSAFKAHLSRFRACYYPPISDHHSKSISDASVDCSQIPSLIVANEGKVICFQSAASKKKLTDQRCNSKCYQSNQNLPMYFVQLTWSASFWKGTIQLVEGSWAKSSTKMGLRQAPSDPHFHPTWNSNSGILNSGSPSDHFQYWLAATCCRLSFLASTSTWNKFLVKQGHFVLLRLGSVSSHTW